MSYLICHRSQPGILQHGDFRFVDILYCWMTVPAHVGSFCGRTIAPLQPGGGSSESSRPFLTRSFITRSGLAQERGTNVVWPTVENPTTATAHQACAVFSFGALRGAEIRGLAPLKNALLKLQAVMAIFLAPFSALFGKLTQKSKLRLRLYINYNTIITSVIPKLRSPNNRS